MLLSRAGKGWHNKQVTGMVLFAFRERIILLGAYFYRNIWNLD